jgi:hypothetical protein
MIYFVSAPKTIVPDVEDIFEVRLVVRETFEDSAEGNSDVEDCNEFELVLGEAHIRCQVGKSFIQDLNHLEGN